MYVLLSLETNMMMLKCLITSGKYRSHSMTVMELCDKLNEINRYE